VLAGGGAAVGAYLTKPSASSSSSDSWSNTFSMAEGIMAGAVIGIGIAAVYFAVKKV